MLAITVDVAQMKLALVGNGSAAERRLAWLDEAGAGNLTVYADLPSAALARAAGHRLVRGLPGGAELAQTRIVFIAEPQSLPARDLVETARAAGALVHVEDDKALSDLHAPATLRRGDLLIAVSTGGKSPALAAEAKRFLAALFGPEWRGRLDDLAALRGAWRRSGADPETIRRRTAEWTRQQGWLDASPKDADRAPRRAPVAWTH
jgi:precorrin-2 dehydrogenase/sirohydrochlorin ferrochelatase